MPVSIDAIKKGRLSNLGAAFALSGACVAKNADEYASTSIRSYGWAILGLLEIKNRNALGRQLDKACYGSRVNWSPVGDFSYAKYMARRDNGLALIRLVLL